MATLRNPKRKDHSDQSRFATSSVNIRVKLQRPDSHKSGQRGKNEYLDKY